MAYSLFIVVTMVLVYIRASGQPNDCVKGSIAGNSFVIIDIEITFGQEVF